MRRFGLVCIGVAALALLGYGVHALTTAGAAHRGSGHKLVPVLAAVVKAQPMPDYVQGLGTVQAFNTVSVKAQVSGQITKVFFNQGQEVKPGEKLFQIDPRPYQAALDQAVAAKDKDRATLEGATADLARYAPLVRQKYTSAKTYQDQKATVAELKATVQADQAAIETARLNLGYTTIRSPIAGRTGQILVNLGNYVQAATDPTLVTIAQIRPIYVNFAVPQARLDAIRNNQTSHTLPVAAIASDGHTVLSHGTLGFINNLIDTSTDTVSLLGTFANTDEKLWPGEYVTARLTLAVQPKALTVPATTVVEGPDGDYAYVIKPDHTVERHAVIVARRQDGMSIISKGLAAGELVVTDGQFRLVNGARVKIDNPAAPAKTAAS